MEKSVFKVEIPGPWAIDNSMSSTWGIINTQTGRTKKLGKVNASGANYYEEAKKLANQRNLLESTPETIAEVLRKIGFEVLSLPGQAVSEDSSVCKGSSPVHPGFGFLGAFALVTQICLEGVLNEGGILVCRDPGTGNLVQVFDLSNSGQPVPF